MSNNRSPDEIFTDEDLRSTGPHPSEGAEPPDVNFTDADRGSTGPHQSGVSDRTEKTCSDRSNEQIDDQKSSGGSDTIVPEVLEEENDDVIVDNESPRGGKYNLRPNPTPNFTDEYRY